MGSPTKTQIEQWSDGVAALVQKDIDGFRSGYFAKASTTLFDMVDASGDPDVETALLGASLDVDEQSLPALMYNWLTTITSRAALRAWAQAVNTLVKSTAGGSYASLRAYLVDKGAKLHPLAAEVFRKALGETLFTTSSVVLGASNPTYGAIFAKRVYRGADGALVDETTDSQSAATGDVTMFAADNHALYIGCDRPFQGFVVALSQLADVTIVPTFQYWNGNAWATLTVTDNTVGFTKNDIVTFTPPTDWTRSYKDAGSTDLADLARLYYVRIARTEDTVGTLPIGSCVTVIPTVVPTAEGGVLHNAGLEQPPLAICRITAASTMTVTLPATIDYTRFAEPVGTESKLRLRALTPIANDLTVTLAYVNAAAANGSTAQSAWTAPAALGTKTLALTSTDALRSVRTTSTVSTSATQGVFVVEALPIRDPAI